MKRKRIIVASLYAIVLSFLCIVRPVQSNPIVVTPGPTPTPRPTYTPTPPPTPTPMPGAAVVLEHVARTGWGILVIGYILTLALELIIVELFTRGSRASGKSPWPLRLLVMGVNTLTFPITQVLAVLIGESLGWSRVVLAELFPLVAEYLVYQWQIPRLHKSGFLTEALPARKVALMTVCANAITFGAGLLLMWIV